MWRVKNGNIIIVIKTDALGFAVALYPGMLKQYVLFLGLWFGYYAGIILCIRPANERRRYIVTSSLISRAHRQNDPCWGFIFAVPACAATTMPTTTCLNPLNLVRVSVICVSAQLTRCKAGSCTTTVSVMLCCSQHSDITSPSNGSKNPHGVCPPEI